MLPPLDHYRNDAHRSLVPLQRLNMPTELKPILQQRQVGDVGGRTLGLDLGDDGCQFAAIHGVAYGGFETLYTTYCEYSGYSGRTRDPLQVRTCRGRRWKTADREQTFVIENNVDQFSGAIARHCRKTAKVHQKRTIAIEHDHCLF